MKTYYITGPSSNLDNATAKLRACGYRIINPNELMPESKALTISILTHLQAAIFTKGWQQTFTTLTIASIILDLNLQCYLYNINPVKFPPITPVSHKYILRHLSRGHIQNLIKRHNDFSNSTPIAVSDFRYPDPTT